MRTPLWTLCLLVGATALHAQSGPQPGPQPWDQGVPAILRDYFDLTAAQILKITRINADLESLMAGKNQVIAGLQAKLDAELKKPILDASAVGALRAGLEQARRDVRAGQVQARTNLLNLLSPDQRRKHQALQDAQDLQPVIDAGISNNFLEGSVTPPPGPPAGVFRKLPERLPTGPRGK